MWKIKGSMYLEKLSGEYSQPEAFATLVRALEICETISDFDCYIEGRDERGNLFSGSQLLEKVSQED